MNLQMTVGKMLAGPSGWPCSCCSSSAASLTRCVNSLIENSYWVAHTHEVLENLEGIISPFEGRRDRPARFPIDAPGTAIWNR